MTRNDVVAVMSEIADLLIESGGSDAKAEWLRDRAELFEAAGLNKASEMALLEEVRRHIPGMNGLVDLHLTPPPVSRYNEESANARLLTLCDELYELTLVS